MRLLLCFFISITCFSQDNKFDWILKKNESGIAVYSRKTVNSNFRELKSIAYVKTSLSSIVALLDDWDTYTQWVYKCGKSTTLKRISSAELIHYQTVVAPWPAENRDFVVNVKFAQDEKTKVVTIKSTCMASYIPPVDHHVRITEFNACWTLIPLKDGTIQVNYQLLVNPGGYVPAWLVNMAAVDGPFETMLHLKEWIVKEKYQKAKISFIKELVN
jgi:hypothetical protein